VHVLVERIGDKGWNAYIYSYRYPVSFSGYEFKGEKLSVVSKFYGVMK